MLKVAILMIVVQVISANIATNKDRYACILEPVEPVCFNGSYKIKECEKHRCFANLGDPCDKKNSIFKQKLCPEHKNVMCVNGKCALANSIQEMKRVPDYVKLENAMPHGFYNNLEYAEILGEYQ